MILRISAENFRSIRNATLSFPAGGGLTAVIGANGSGKSNVIKLLQFIGQIGVDGVEGAIRLNGGFEGVFPKSLTPPKLRESTLSISYDVVLPGKEDTDQPTLANHFVKVAHPASHHRRQLLREETLHFRKLSTPSTSGREHSDLQIRFTSVDNGRMDINTFDRSDDDYAKWLGLEALGSVLTGEQGPRSLAALLQLIITQVNATETADRGRFGGESMIGPSSMLRIIEPARALTLALRNIRRYDLQLAELRKQQEIEQARDLTPDGRGMPSAVQRLKTDGSHPDAWRSVSSVLREMSPHVRDAGVSQLKSGQEFVQFLERDRGRPVESWQASDGTLRALAILVALETVPAQGMVLVEEPEMGLHPWAIRTLIHHFRDVIERRGVQIVMSTHSQQVLDELEPQEVRVAIRSLENGTEFRELSDIAPQAHLDRGDVGRLWVSGLLSGVPEPYPE